MYLHFEDRILKGGPDCAGRGQSNRPSFDEGYHYCSKQWLLTAYRRVSTRCVVSSRISRKPVRSAACNPSALVVRFALVIDEILRSAQNDKGADFLLQPGCSTYSKLEVGSGM